MKSALKLPALAGVGLLAMLMIACSSPTPYVPEPDPVTNQSVDESTPEEVEPEPELPDVSPNSILEGTGSTIDQFGYTVNLEAALALSAWEVSVENSLPGQAEASSSLSGYVTITNTTSGRETPFRSNLWLVVGYPVGSIGCDIGTGKVITTVYPPTMTADQKYCIRVFADFMTVMLAPGESRNLDFAIYSDPPVLKVTGQEDQMDSLISTLSSPSFIYLASVPSDSNGQTKGNPEICSLAVSLGTHKAATESVIIASPGFVCSP